MTNRPSIRNGFFAAATAAGWVGVCLFCVAGCEMTQREASFDDTSHSEPVEAEFVSAGPPTRPTLSTAGDANLTLFGEFPGTPGTTYQSRSGASMKQHSFTQEGADFDVDLSPDGGRLIFASTRHTTQPDLYIKAIDGNAVTQITRDPSPDVQPCFSPDGRMVAFASHRGGNWDLWMVDLEGGPPTQITESPMHEVHPSFAPDGRRMVYSVFNDRSGQWEMWTLDLAQPGTRKMIGLGLFPEWSPRTDKDTIVFQRARQRGGRWFGIWKIDLVDGEPSFPVELAASADTAFITPSWSPDGHGVVYGSALPGVAINLPDDQAAFLERGDIWIMNNDGSGRTVLTDRIGAHFGPAWGSDGRIYFTSRQTGHENIWSVTAGKIPTSAISSVDDGIPTQAGSFSASAAAATPGSGG